MSKPKYWMVLKSAHGEVGYLEKASNSDLEPKVGSNVGSNNWTKYAKYIWDKAKAQGKTKLVSEIDYGAAWCDLFHDYNMLVGSGDSVADASTALCGKFDDYTVSSLSYYKKAGRFGDEPRLGAQIFFGTGKSSPTHTGHVYAYGKTMVKTIEGNTSAGTSVVANGGGVHRKEYSLGNSRIIGYGYPKYSEEPPKPGAFTAKKTLKVREDAKKSAKQVGSLAAGSSFTAEAVRVGPAGNTWAYSDSLGGWVMVRNGGNALA